MAANMTPTSVNTTGAPELIRSTRDIEFVKLQGSSTSAGDTSTTYTSKMPNPSFCDGAAFVSSVSGRSVTFKSLVALGGDAMYVTLYSA